MPLLHNLTEPQLWRLARAMLTAEFAKGDLVFKKARPAAAAAAAHRVSEARREVFMILSS